MKKFLQLSAILLVSACTFNQMDNGLIALRGKNIKTAFQYLGYPDGQQQIAGDNVYVWGRSFSTVSNVPVTNYNRGTISGYGGFANYSGTSTSYIPQVNHYSCALKIVTDSSDIIINSQYEGNIGGCARYGEALNLAATEIKASYTAAESSLTEEDKHSLDTAKESAYSAPIGKKISWKNKASGNSGSITALKEGTSSSGRYCREYQQTIIVGGQKQSGYGTACRQPDGSWEVVN